MDKAIELVVQVGALGLLGYIIFWVTREGAPKFWTAMDGIKNAITENTQETKSVKEGQKQQLSLAQQTVDLLVRLVDRDDQVGEETMRVARKLEDSKAEQKSQEG